MTDSQQPTESTASPLNQRLDIAFALQATGIGVWEYDPATRQVLWDDQCRALFGLAKENPLSYEQAFQFIHPDDIARIDAAAQRIMNPLSDGIFDEKYRTIGADDGKLRWVRFQGRVTFTPAGEVSRYAGVAQDVTQQVLAQQKLEASERALREMVLAAPIGISVLNAADLVIEIVNDSFLEVAGKPYEALMGQPYWIPFAEAAYYEEALNQVIRSGEPFNANEIELMLIRQGKEEIIYVTFVYMPIRDFGGRVSKVVVWVLENTRQVSERRKVEGLVKERTKELLVSNQNLKRSNDNLLQFAYIASHDLQEPLRKIQSFSGLLKDQYTEALGEGVDHLNRMQAAASRMSTLIRDLLTFSRISTRPEEVDSVVLAEVMDTALYDLELIIVQTAAQVTVEPLPIISGDKLQLGQLFQNLLSNALKFHRDGVPPVVAVRCQQVPADLLHPNVWPTRLATSYYRIEVKDNGIGFDQKYVERIFQVFQRLHGKSRYPGTGIGLAICEKVVVNHGGAITATSQPGQGATFTVYLPA